MEEHTFYLDSLTYAREHMFEFGDAVLDFDADADSVHGSETTDELMSLDGSASYGTGTTIPMVKLGMERSTSAPGSASGRSSRDARRRRLEDEYTFEDDSDDEDFGSSRRRRGSKSSSVHRRSYSDDVSYRGDRPSKRSRTKRQDAPLAESRLAEVLGNSAVHKSRFQYAKGGSDAKKSDRPQTSSFRGVSCCGKDRKWQARIRDGNRVHYLGRYNTAIEAALVYDRSAREKKGDQAATNFVPLDAESVEIVISAFSESGVAAEGVQRFLTTSVMARVNKLG